MVVYDELIVLNCVFSEQVAGRLLLNKCAVKRGPRSPDFEGLKAFLFSDFDQAGGVRAQDFKKYVSDVLKEETEADKEPRQEQG